MRLMRMESIRLAFNFSSWKPTKQEWLLGISCVQPEEKDRIMKFIGRLLMRKVLSEHLNIPFNKVILKRTTKGKPYLGDFTVLAAQPHVAVGVDVMKTVYPSGSSTVTSFFHTMRKQFTPDEWQTIKSQEGEWKQLEIFYRHWKK
ncbi:L-aminoadipate-semialdehyde dehydrogenase-phosphopantetheinyl transferase [Acropora cervicornis]|uniref:holo-[acyl-carrier-protein] synthase n=1 Tax=Acropora cervicornis TaxID=6130 RepID=A0AAD9V6N1_ACRCE|nr:L-aminoadipate-semialdehyde dehydrogenase-phosphopantetheinyl transferase [Acropora cervicornis]